jgi:hypothetical protein
LYRKSRICPLLLGTFVAQLSHSFNIRQAL